MDRLDIEAITTRSEKFELGEWNTRQDAINCAHDVPALLSEVDRLKPVYDHCMGCEIDCAKEFWQNKENEFARLTARAEAAEADLRKCAPCWLCKKKCGIFDALDQRKDGCCPNFEWRGPQEAGKGEAE